METRPRVEGEMHGLLRSDLEPLLSSWIGAVCNARKSVSMLTQELIPVKKANCFVTCCDLNSAKNVSLLKLKQAFRVHCTSFACMHLFVYLVLSLRSGPMTSPAHFRVLGLIQSNHIESKL